jgi:hypothetical protein
MGNDYDVIVLGATILDRCPIRAPKQDSLAHAK